MVAVFRLQTNTPWVSLKNQGPLFALDIKWLAPYYECPILRMVPTTNVYFNVDKFNTLTFKFIEYTYVSPPSSSANVQLLIIQLKLFFYFTFKMKSI